MLLGTITLAVKTAWPPWSIVTAFARVAAAPPSSLNWTEYTPAGTVPAVNVEVSCVGGVGDVK